jgi:hypothetical protein
VCNACYGSASKPMAARRVHKIIRLVLWLLHTLDNYLRTARLENMGIEIGSPIRNLVSEGQGDPLKTTGKRTGRCLAQLILVHYPKTPTLYPSSADSTAR